MKRNVIFVFALIFLCAASAFGQELRGYKVGRYEGEAVNANVKGKIEFEIKEIDAASGNANAFFKMLSPLAGEVALAGKIDATGILRLNGTTSDGKITLAGRVKDNEIKANYRMTGATVQNGTFTAKFMPDIDPPDTGDEIEPPAEDEKPKTTTTTTTTTTSTSPSAPKNPTSSGGNSENDDEEEAKYAKPDLSEFERWFEIVNYNYDVFKNKLIITAKPKVESRPTYYTVKYLDGGNMAVYETSVYISSLLQVGETSKIEIVTPGEATMEKVKNVRITRTKQ